MRFSAAELGVLLLLVGCGKSAVDGGSGGTTSEPMAGAPSDGGSTSAGAPSASGSTAVGGSAGTSAGGSVASGGAPTTGGVISGGAAATGGEAPSGGSTSDGLVDCDPKKVLCKRTPPTCAGFTVPEVVDGCYGECVKIERCACSSANQCPDPGQFTCWSKQHCGPFVN
jgi:hypothetical protein